MTHAVLEERVGRLEQEQVRQGEQIVGLRAEVGGVGQDVKQLLARDAARPEGLTWKALAGLCAGAITIAIVGGWLIAMSPAVLELDRRVSRLDDPTVGRVQAVERRLEKLDGWGARVTRAGK